MPSILSIVSDAVRSEHVINSGTGTITRFWVLNALES